MGDSEGVERGDGWSVATLDALGEGPGFRKIRRELGVEEFGVNGIVLPPGYDTGYHAHERQEELYIVLDGTVEIGFNDGTTHVLRPGGLARVSAPVQRKMRNIGDSDATYVVVGAAGGYVGRDGVEP